MLLEDLNQDRSGATRAVRHPRHVRTGVVAAVALLAALAAGTAASQPEPPATPAPEPTPAPTAAPRTLSLKIGDVLSHYERGNAEFDPAVRRVVWDDPMARLAGFVAREQAAARRGGLIGLPDPIAPGNVMLTVPGPSSQLVLAGPFAADWRTLTAQEKAGRLAETAVAYGIMFEVMRALAGSGH